MPRTILLFIDGLGIGKQDPEVNPLFRAELPNLRSLLGGMLPHSKAKRVSSRRAQAIPVNATLGVPGLPQSGTGQTAIFTGVNGPKLFGRHFGPYPPTVLRPVIQEKNIFRQLKSYGKSVCFTNAFPKRFFEYTSEGTRRLTVTTLSCTMSGVNLLTGNDLKENRGISADFTRTRWPELGNPDVTPTTSREAGKHLWNIALDHDFTLFEYWLTDHAGHSQKMDLSVEVLERLDEFLGGFFDVFDDRSSSFISISDHGNIEDLSTKSHTRNPVPCIIAGKSRKKLADRIKNLTHITPSIVKFLRES
ncbi:MAG: metalloenzyme [Bacteroidota bacterium]